MDLPTCPSCGQSVLDDDAEDCPFCGASMTGKPSPRSKQPKDPSSSAAAAPSSTATLSPEKSVPKKAGGGKQEPPPAGKEEAEEDPFELERKADAKKRVVPLHPRPQPGRRHKVVCPMCETAGYTSRKAAGRDVRCANPDCRFPIFTAPPLTEEEGIEAAEEKAEESSSLKRFATPVNISAGVTVLLLILLVGWYIGFGTKKQPRSNPLDNVSVTPSGKTPDESLTKKTTLPEKKKEKQPSVDPALRREKIRDEALVQIEREAASDRHSDVTKIIARHYAADAYALVGRTAQAEKLVEKLKFVTRRGGRFYRVRPLISLAWNAAQAGTEKPGQPPGRFVDEALSILQDLPADVGPEGYSAVARTAAALVALNRPDEADRLLARFDRSDSSAQEALLLLTVEEFRSFDVEEAWKLRPAHNPASPLRVAVTLLLTARGKWKIAWNWTEKQTDHHIRAECQVAWAEARLLTQNPRQSDGQAAGPKKADTKNASRSPRQPAGEKSDQKLLAPQEVASRLPAEYRALLLSRLAIHQHKRGQSTAAQKFVSEARQILDTIPVPPYKKPGIRDVLTSSPLLSAEKRRRVITASAAAQWAQAQLTVDLQQISQAWNSLQRSLSLSRSLSYSTADLQRLKKVTEAEIGRVMNVKQAAEIARLASDYRDRLRNRQTEADARFRFQVQILERALEWGFPALLPAVGNAMMAGEKTESPKPSVLSASSGDPWFSTLIPWMLILRLEAAGNNSLANSLRERLREYRQQFRGGEEKRTVLWVQAHRELRQPEPNYRKLGLLFAPAAVDPSWRRLLALKIAAYLVNRQKTEAAYQFARALDRDRVLQIDAFHVLGGLATRRQGAETVWKMIEEKPLNPWESTALSHSLIAVLTPPAETARQTGTAPPAGTATASQTD